MKRMRKAQSKQTETGFSFEPNAFYEKVLNLRRTNPRDFDSLAPVTKISLGQYETAKREAQRLQAIRDESEAA